MPRFTATFVGDVGDQGRLPIAGLAATMISCRAESRR